MKIKEWLLYSTETLGILWTGREDTSETSRDESHQGRVASCFSSIPRLKYDFVVLCNRISLVCVWFFAKRKFGMLLQGAVPRFSEMAFCCVYGIHVMLQRFIELLSGIIPIQQQKGQTIKNIYWMQIFTVCSITRNINEPISKMFSPALADVEQITATAWNTHRIAAGGMCPAIPSTFVLSWSHM